MASTFRASASNTGNSSSPSVSKPTGTADGDYVLWGVFQGQIFGGSLPTITPPTGYTLIRAQTDALNSKFAVYGKVASSEPSTLTGSSSSSSQWMCFAIAIQSGGSPGVDVSATGTNSDGTANVVFPAITSNYANECLAQIEAWADGGGSAISWTPDAAMTETLDFNDGTNNSSVMVAYKDLTTATSYGSYTYTSSQNVGTNYGLYISVIVGDNLAPVATGRPHIIMARQAVGRAGLR